MERRGSFDFMAKWVRPEKSTAITLTRRSGYGGAVSGLDLIQKPIVTNGHDCWFQLPQTVNMDSK